MTCETAKGFFLEAYYGELADAVRKEFYAHIDSCADCAREYRNMEATLVMMAERRSETPGSDFSSRLWDNVKAQIDSDATIAPKTIRFIDQLRNISTMPAWAYGIAAVLFIAIGIYTGRTFFAPSSVEPKSAGRETTAISPSLPDSNSAEEVQKDVDAYLDRSRTLLLGLIHSPESHPSLGNIERQQQMSRELILQATNIESKLNSQERERFKQLIGDLGVILRELANYSRENGVPLIELVKQGVDTKSILLKINIEQIRSLDARLKSHEPAKSTEPKSKI